MQETPPSAPSGAALLADTPWVSSLPVIRMRFTDIPLLSSSYFIHQQTGVGRIGAFVMRDCEVRGGGIALSPSLDSQVMAWTNTLFERVDTQLYPYAYTTLNVRNCLFQEGRLEFSSPGNNTSWNVYDNHFNTTNLHHYGSFTFSHGYNAYATDHVANRFTPTNSTDVVVTNFVFETGPLGRYYQQSTNLVNQGQVSNAGWAGLYHYTTQHNQTKEGTSRVDIGYHYVAVDESGVPIDTDGDGLPDYLEDSNGNGTFDSGETDWQTYNSLYGIGSGAGLRVFTILQ